MRTYMSGALPPALTGRLSYPARWQPGEVYHHHRGISPLLATWERHDHPSQVRMRAYLLDLSERLDIASLPGEVPLFLDLVIDVLEPSRLSRHYDLENYLTPVAIHLGWQRFFLVRGVKRVGGGSEISIGRAEPARLGLTAPWVQTTIDAGGSVYKKTWKERLRLALKDDGHSVLPPGPVCADLAWRCAASRNWVMLWKPTGDAMGPVLGEPDLRNPFNVADDRIVQLALHREIDDRLGHGIHAGIAWRMAE